MSTTTIQQEQQETIPQELVEKFDGDKQLVQEFIKEGYSIEQLSSSTVLHATKFDPLVLIDGITIGMWLDGGKKYQENSRTYQNRFS
jgi:hypothetical protein